MNNQTRFYCFHIDLLIIQQKTNILSLINFIILIFIVYISYLVFEKETIE